MTTLNFPQDPVFGDVYEFASYTYKWDGEKWKTIGTGSNPANELRKEVFPKLDITNTYSIEGLRRSYSEAGYNLVSGSFATGGTLISQSDVLLNEKDGKAYSWTGTYPDGGYVVAPGMDPNLSSSFVSKDHETFRSEFLSDTGAIKDHLDFNYYSRNNSIRAHGASPSASALVNTNAIKSAIAASDNVFVDPGVYSILMNEITIPTGKRIFGIKGMSIIQGPDPDTTGSADGSGTAFLLDGADGITIESLVIKNGYKGIGVKAVGCENLTIKDVEVDGFTYGMWIGESSSKKGCQHVNIIRPVIKNTRYWGIYVRCLGVTVEGDKTYDVNCIRPYFYNCNMAAWVCAEGNSNHIKLLWPTFRRCNVCMHFETASDYEVIGARDFDTGKKPDHVNANTEYPFVGWSLYHAFTSGAVITDCVLEKEVVHHANPTGRCTDVKYTNVTANVFNYEGVGAAQDVDKNCFESHSFTQCISRGPFIYQQPSDQANSYIRNMKISNCECKQGESGNSGSGSYVAANIQRGVHFTLSGSLIRNACLRLKISGLVQITDNKFVGGTDDTQSVFDGVSGSLGAGNFVDVTGNQFERAGGAVQGDSAILLSNWTRVRADNAIRVNSRPYAYRFKDNYRVELGIGLMYDFTTGPMAESGTAEIKYLWRDA